ncbi:MAG: DedA family protein [Candidatus Ozemobacteraceae bacterium]
MDWFAHLAPLIEHGSYFAVFMILVLCGLGLPVPEEVTFLLAGFVVEKIGGSLELMISIALVGVLLGDSCLFALASRHGMSLLGIWPFRLMFSPRRIERAQRFFKKHGSKTVFFAGFFAGVRAPTFFLSATMGVGFARFFFWDAARAVLTCPISIWFGFHFGPYAQERLAPYKNWLLTGFGVIILLIILREIHLRRNLKDHPEDTSHP